MASSIFTKIINKEIPCFKIAENDDFIAFLDINPLQKGHTLVVPKKEVDYIFDNDDEILSKMLPFAKRVSLAIRKVIECNRIGITVIGLEVPHAHMHLIPINKESDMNFSSQRISLNKEELENLAKNISKVFV